MSILIKGMEMPQTCEDCNCESFCNLWVEARRLCGETFTDVKSRIKATIRHPDCPLVEVKPHGKLIDVRALTNAIEDITWYHQNKNKDMVEGANSSEEQAWYREQDIYAAIDAAPTVIEAEDSFFNSLKCGLEQAINGDVRETTMTKENPYKNGHEYLLNCAPAITESE